MNGRRHSNTCACTHTHTHTPISSTHPHTNATHAHAFHTYIHTRKRRRNKRINGHAVLPQLAPHGPIEQGPTFGIFQPDAYRFRLFGGACVPRPAKCPLEALP